MYQWKKPDYETEHAEESTKIPFSEVAAVVLASVALVLFVVGLIGYFGMRNSSQPNPVFQGMLDGSLLGTATDFVAIIVILVAERRRTR